jgi:hypothetical protein
MKAKDYLINEINQSGEYVSQKAQGYIIKAMRLYTISQTKSLKIVVVMFLFVFCFLLVIIGNQKEELRSLRTDTLFKSICLEKDLQVMNKQKATIDSLVNWHKLFYSSTKKQVTAKIREDKMKRLMLD